jgi:glutamate-1-semialdehyde 2,1-aminomutase
MPAASRTSSPVTVDRAHLGALIDAELQMFAEANPRSREHHCRAISSLLSGVPMPWMAKAVGEHPIYLESAGGSRVTDVDDHEYIDFALGDTGSMAGHSPPPVMAAIEERIRTRGGITAMMPALDGVIVAEELTRRFELPNWQYTLTATDANRSALRMARQIQRRPFALIFEWSYHGSVDETVAIFEGGVVRPKPGSVGPPVDPALTTRVADFNDIESVRAALHDRQVACLLAEPAMTNCGIVLPDPGFWHAVQELCAETETLLILDETHTFSAGPGGCTRAWELEPDMLTIGKSLGSGIPIGAYGVTEGVAQRIAADPEGDYLDWGGVGGTLAGNALSLAAAKATLTEVLDDAAFAHMVAMADRYVAGVQGTLEDRNVPWSIVQLGARAEYHFAPAPRTGREARAVLDDELDRFMHLFMLNRGILMTPFHNMALMSPSTEPGDVDQHTALFGEAIDALFT